MSTPTRTVLSLGGGTQSSCLLLMACAGVIGPLDAVVFADTGGELPETYAYLDYLRSQAERAGIEFLTVTAGDLRTDLVAKAGKGGQPNLPVKIRHADGRVGRLNRYRCSYDYKRRPITRAVKQLCGPRGAWKHATVQQWIGYSAEEAGRIKPADECRCGHKRVRRASPGRPFEQIHTDEGCTRCSCRGFDPWQINRWPLIELGMTRADCQQWITDHGHPPASRSACWYCPNRPARHWTTLRLERPDLWHEAVQLDEFVRHGVNGLHGQAYLHPTATPLATTARSDEQPDADHEALDCEAGVCFT